MTIYSIDDLMAKPFDDEEIDVVSKSLLYSLIIGMFEFCKIKKTHDEIIQLCKKDDWFKEFYWTKIQKEQYRKKINKVFYNLYRFGPVKCQNSADEWIIRYGFELKDSHKKNHKKHHHYHQKKKVNEKDKNS